MRFQITVKLCNPAIGKQMELPYAEMEAASIAAVIEELHKKDMAKWNHEMICTGIVIEKVE